MAQEPMNDLTDGMERMGEMTFDNLSDIAIMQIFDKLDIRSRHRMRGVSKRMNEIQLKVKNNMEKIKVAFPTGSSRVLTLMEQGFGIATIRPRDDNSLVHALSQLAVNTHSNKLELVIEENRFNSRIHAINKLFDIEADELELSPLYSAHDEDEINISVLLSLAQKFRRISSEFRFSSLTLQDFYLIRENMIKGAFKLESFSIAMWFGWNRSASEEFFGVTREVTIDKENHLLYSIFRASDESVEVYTDETRRILCQFENNLRTTVYFNKHEITIEKCKAGAKPDDNYEKVKMNRQYVYKYK